MTIILNRQNTIASEVIGENAPCWIIGYLTASDGVADGDDHWRRAYTTCFEHHGMTKVQHIIDPDDPDCAYDIFAARTIWRHGAFDTALRDIANDQIRVMWMSETTGAIFAPYDGGMDLILPSHDDIQAQILSHSAWLSSHPGGY